MSHPFDGLEAAPVVPDAVKQWQFKGLILLSQETGPRIRGGSLDLEELSLFVQRVRTEMPGALVVCHEHGLRAIWSDGSGDGPRLDWSDWE